MATMTGKRGLMEMLRAEGVKYIFGNPTATPARPASLPSSISTSRLDSPTDSAFFTTPKRAALLWS